MTNLPVKFSYVSTRTPKFKASVDPLQVSEGDQIVFTGETDVPNSQFKISFEPGSFDPEEVIFDAMSPPSTITSPAIKVLRQGAQKDTEIHCQLIDKTTKAVKDETKGKAGSQTTPGKGGH
jgi:hypothetical protein